ncbi:hypothetical protein IWX90DRAFT_481995 [Phyllosticta citrichinensis]|uniref:C2H2-type domain-containing protein n=1 Tax=Phyllosticta citrichinensis TaxID=1130410 RepID=A0ABR1Y5E1_9PEZI
MVIDEEASNATDIQHPNCYRICGMDFTRRAALITHFEANHAENQLFRCAACGADVGRFSTLRRHQRQNCPANRAPPAAGPQQEESSEDDQSGEGDGEEKEDGESEDVNTSEDPEDGEDMSDDNPTSDSGSASEAVHPPSHSTDTSTRHWRHT